jgi:hypothetical protein
MWSRRNRAPVEKEKARREKRKRETEKIEMIKKESIEGSDQSKDNYNDGTRTERDNGESALDVSGHSGRIDGRAGGTGERGECSE